MKRIIYLFVAVITALGVALVAPAMAMASTSDGPPGGHDNGHGTGQQHYSSTTCYANHPPLCHPDNGDQGNGHQNNRHQNNSDQGWGQHYWKHHHKVPPADDTKRDPDTGLTNRCKEFLVWDAIGKTWNKFVALTAGQASQLGRVSEVGGDVQDVASDIGDPCANSYPVIHTQVH